MGKFQRVPQIKDAYDYVEKHPWDMEVKPFRCAPHVWYVSGNEFVGAYIIDTGDGLILLDTYEQHALYQLTEGIREAGFDPHDIKIILLSHGHQDHCGGMRAMQALTGAKSYMSKEDYEIKQTHPERVLFAGGTDFDVDAFYSDDTPIQLGHMTIHTRLTPGHTPGTTSFWFDDTDEETGKTYRCAMHGGAGTPFMMTKLLNEYGYPLSLKQRFIDDCREMAQWDVDICIASHHNFSNFFSNINQEDRSDYTGFVDQSIWREFMLERAADAEKLP